MSISNYAELKILDHVGGTAWTAPTTLYIKLHTADPGEDGTTAASAMTTRVAVPSWAVASAGSKATSASMSWPAAASAETHTHWSAWDTVGPAGGNCIWTGPLSASATVAIGDVLQISTLTLTLD